MTDEGIKERLDNKLCLVCGQPISSGKRFFCDKCYDEANEKIKKNGISKDWDIYSLILIMGIFGWNGEEYSTEKLKEILSNKGENDNEKQSD